jgi:hypothetical protein
MSNSKDVVPYTTLDVLVINMKSIAAGAMYQKYIIVDDRFIIADRRYLQSVLRYLTGDNREALVEFLQKMVQDITYYMRRAELNDDQRIKLMQILPSFRAGLSKLRITYSFSSEVIVYSLENITDQVDLLIRDISKLLRVRKSSE